MKLLSGVPPQDKSAGCLSTAIANPLGNLAGSVAMSDVQFTGCECGSGACLIQEDGNGTVVVTCECGTQLGSWQDFMNKPLRPQRANNAVEVQSKVRLVTKFGRKKHYPGWQVR